MEFWEEKNKKGQWCLMLAVRDYMCHDAFGWNITGGEMLVVCDFGELIGTDRW